VAYKYDIFFSYKHSEEWRPWVFGNFLPALKDALRVELDRDIKLFLDVNEINPQQQHVKILISSLGLALGYSRCMVAVWQPSYFESIWCWNECRSFAKRIKQDSSWSPIFPVTIFNGEFFPPWARVFKSLYLSDCSSPAISSNSFIYDVFYEKIRNGAHDLSEIIKDAPEWRSEWISEAWFDEEPPRR
jgi:hypothetical protein